MLKMYLRRIIVLATCQQWHPRNNYQFSQKARVLEFSDKQRRGFFKRKRLYKNIRFSANESRIPWLVYRCISKMEAREVQIDSLVHRYSKIRAVNNVITAKFTKITKSARFKNKINTWYFLRACRIGHIHKFHTLILNI